MSPFKRWLASLVHAVVAGGANAAVGMLADPSHFNFSPDGLVALAKLAGAGALIGLMMYLKQSPIPAEWDGENRRKE